MCNPKMKRRDDVCSTTKVEEEKKTYETCGNKKTPKYGKCLDMQGYLLKNQGGSKKGKRIKSQKRQNTVWSVSIHCEKTII